MFACVSLKSIGWVATAVETVWKLSEKYLLVAVGSEHSLCSLKGDDGSLKHAAQMMTSSLEVYGENSR